MSDLISRQAEIDESYQVVIDGDVFDVVQVEMVFFLKPFDYCPNCGADMRGGNDEIR